MNGKSTFGSVSKKYREKENLSQAKFANTLGEKMDNFSLSSQAVSLWENEETQPSLDFLFRVYLLYNDWRKDWAIDAIIAKRPNLFMRDVDNGILVFRHDRAVN